MRAAGTTDVLNLCFHGIGRPERTLEPSEERFWIEPDAFDEMLTVIEGDEGVRVTFDDGNASDVEIALPALLRRRLSASFFVIAGRCGQPGSLARKDLRKLAQNGMTVGSHGMRHVPWRSLDEAALREELVDAPRLIAEASGRAVSEASCPFGSYDRRVLAALRRHGFSRVYTVDEGPANRNAWLQARYTVQASDTGERIAELVRDPRQGIGTAAVRSLKQSVKRWR
jgi:peptidoglycan/xylan/chitin deacetylase (PgdA/CDA1 family)